MPSMRSMLAVDARGIRTMCELASSMPPSAIRPSAVKCSCMTGSLSKANIEDCYRWCEDESSALDADQGARRKSSKETLYSQPSACMITRRRVVTTYSS